MSKVTNPEPSSRAPEVDPADLVRRELVVNAKAILSAAEADYAAAEQALATAEQALESARRAPESLWRHAVDGNFIKDSDIDAVFDVEGRLLNRVAFRKRLVQHNANLVRQAREQIIDATNRAHLPVLLLAAERRIAAAVLIDAARATFGHRVDAAKFEVARGDWEQAGELLAFVQKNCTVLRTIALATFQTASAAAERKMWAPYLQGGMGVPGRWDLRQAHSLHLK